MKVYVETPAHPKPLVYLASPYVKQSPSYNALYHGEMYRQIVMDAVVTPVAPLLAHHVPGHEIVGEARWMEFDLELLQRCDALFTFNVWMQFAGKEYSCTESSGRDTEVRLMESLGRPVFWDRDALYAWARSWK